MIPIPNHPIHIYIYIRELWFMGWDKDEEVRYSVRDKKQSA